MKRLTFGASLACTAALILPAAASSTDWPQLGHTNAHNSYTSVAGITNSNASQLGVQWMANLYSADLSSPVVAWNVALGKTLVYVGNERGDFFAVDAANGQLVWSKNFGVGDSIRSTPAIAEDGSVWVGTAYNPHVYKLDGASGATLCSAQVIATIDASMMLATPPGQPETVYFGTNNNANGAGIFYGLHESDCSTVFNFLNYVTPTASSWATPAYATGANNEPLAIFGSTDPDSHAYAIDAVTGALVWSYFPIVGPGTWDLGTATTISPPGVNGFTNGVAYMQTKYGLEMAMDPATGNELWQYGMFPNGYTGARDARSGAALDGNALVFGYQRGVDSINATTGALNWEYATPLEVISSPAIAGPTGSEIVTFGDVGGKVHAINLADGSSLYSYQTGGFITSSPAIINGQVFIASSDGFLYAYGVGGSNAAHPSSTITVPINNSSVANPNGSLTITGSSADAAGVGAVEVAIQTNGPSGPWWDGATGTFQNAPYRNGATLAAPGATSTTWSYSFPALPSGGSYQLYANTVNTGHIADKGAASLFSIKPSNSEPRLSLSSSFVQPGYGFQVTGHSFKPGEQVQYTLFGQVVATVQTQGTTGYVPNTHIAVPSAAPFGATSLIATGLTSGKVSSATVTVTNEWSQLGNNAKGTNFESHDSTLVNILNVGTGTVLNQAWSYATGSAVNASPVIVNNVAYVGNDAGTLSAVLTSSGAPLWKYKTPSHAQIRSSAAVDLAGSIFFGSADGNLYTLNLNGTLVRTLALGGTVSSPALDNGQVYVATTGGTLYDIPEATGTVLWSVPLGAAIHSSPTYDATANTVIIGDDSGAITAFNSTNGTQLWKVHTGNAVTAQAAIQAGQVLIGSGDSRFYDINELTGAIVWTFSADGPITSGAAINGLGSISFGDQHSTLYFLDKNGGLIYAQTGQYRNSPIVGVAGIENNIMVETASGFLGSTRLDAGAAQTALFIAQTGAGFASAPAILDGTVYAGAGDGNLYAYSPHGVTPLSRSRGGPIITVTNAWTCTTTP